MNNLQRFLFVFGKTYVKHFNLIYLSGYQIFTFANIEIIHNFTVTFKEKQV